MASNNRFINFLKNELISCEKYLKDTDAYDLVPEKRESEQIACYEKLAVIYKYINYEEKSSKMFRHLTTFGAGVSTSKLDVKGLSEEDKKNTSLLCDIGGEQLKKGVCFNLAKINPQKARRLFEWAAENCYLSEESIAYEIRTEYFNNIAVGHLWRGYALLNLGRYEEAYELLIQVIPYFNKWKKSGGEVWQKVEYALSRALVPLCEYKLEPTQENLQKTKTGIEEYIKSLRENRDKLEGYLYYFHLKEYFADVYTAEKAPEQTKAPAKIKKAAKNKKLNLPPGEYDTTGTVTIVNMNPDSLDEEFGTQNELEDYVEKVRNLGDFPVLSSLMELYALENEQDPMPLVEECKRLLSRPDVETDTKEKTKSILKVAKDAQKAGYAIMLHYFEPEV